MVIFLIFLNVEANCMWIWGLDCRQFGVTDEGVIGHENDLFIWAKFGLLSIWRWMLFCWFTMFPDLDFCVTFFFDSFFLVCQRIFLSHLLL